MMSPEARRALESIPANVIELVPVVVMLENRIIPVVLEDHDTEEQQLVLVVEDTTDRETLEKIMFILNRMCRFAEADEHIEIWKHMGEILQELESNGGGLDGFLFG